MGMQIIVGAEIEAYAIPKDPDFVLDLFLLDLAQAAKEASIACLTLEKERGHHQWEWVLPSIDALSLAKQIETLRFFTEDYATKHNVTVSFKAKPFADQPGSGLHFHMHLTDAKGHNLFAKPPNSNDETKTMYYALGGLCQWMLPFMVFFAPTEGCYTRYKEGKEVPTHLCWGGNNRTAALRLPNASGSQRRIEHRVASAEANSYLALYAIVKGTYYGLRDHILPPPKLFGDAFDPQYALTRLPLSLEEAVALYQAYHAQHGTPISFVA
jgi:glutamine synthetase